MDLSIDFKYIIPFFTGIISFVIFIWRLSKYLDQMSSKKDTQDLRISIQELTIQVRDIRYELVSLEKELNARTPISKFDLLLKDVDFLKNQVITKEDLFIFKEELIKELKHELN